MVTVEVICDCPRPAWKCVVLSETALPSCEWCIAEHAIAIPGLISPSAIWARAWPTIPARCGAVSASHIQHLKRSINQIILDQVWITTAGIVTQPPILAALLTYGIDRTLLSFDYPFSTNEQGRFVLDELSLAPHDLAKSASP